MPAKSTVHTFLDIVRYAIDAGCRNTYELALGTDMTPAAIASLFDEHTQTSPEKFLQLISPAAIRKQLQAKNGSTSSNPQNIVILPMTREEWANGGKSLTVYYNFGESSFGRFLCGSTDRGICHLSFTDAIDPLEEMRSRFPGARLIEAAGNARRLAIPSLDVPVTLHVMGTSFQIAVWQQLASTRPGTLTTYASMADNLGNASAARAVGTAVGSNPVAYLIPCHRAVQSSGRIGGYRWGPARKATMIVGEHMHTE